MKARFFKNSHRCCFVCLLAIVIVCGSASYGHAQSYYPDDFGNTWILRSTDGIDERLVTIEGPETIGTESLKVISDGTYPVSDPASNKPNKLFIKAEQDQILIFRATATVQGIDVTIDYSPPEIFLPSPPIEKGREWAVIGEARLGVLPIKVTTTAKVVDVVPVTVPVGTFQNCLEIEQEFSTSGLVSLSIQSTMWLAPEVGLVKSLNSSGVIFELIDYNVTIDDIVVAVEPKGKLAMTWGALKKR